MALADRFRFSDFQERSSYLDYTTSSSATPPGHQTFLPDFASPPDFSPEDSGDVVSYFQCDNEETKDLCKSGFDTLVLSWYLRLLHPSKSYLEHLDYFRSHDRDGNFTDYKAGGRIAGFYFYQHKKDKETWVAVPDVVCDNYNPCAKFKSIRSSASRTYSQLKNLKGCENIIFLDLTFPKEISQLLITTDPSRVVEKARETVDLFIELLAANLESHINENKSEENKQSLGDFSLGYQFNPHLWSSADPTQPHLHIHLDLLWAAFQGDGLTPLKFHERGKPLSEDLVKKLWKKAVSQVFNFDYGGKSPVLHLDWSPLTWGNKVLHRLKYRRRKPVTDLGEYYLDNEFDPDSFDFQFNQFLLDYTNKSYTFGFWTFLVKFLGDSKDSANVKVCPICGEKVTEEAYVPLGEAVFDRVVVLNRSGSAYSVKPPPEEVK